jgi:hypothetical protein
MCADRKTSPRLPPSRPEPKALREFRERSYHARDKERLTLLRRALRKTVGLPEQAWRDLLATEWALLMTPVQCLVDAKELARGISLIGRPAQALVQHLYPLADLDPGHRSHSVIAAAGALLAAGDLSQVERYMPNALSHVDRYVPVDDRLRVVASWHPGLQQRVQQEPTDHAPLLAMITAQGTSANPLSAAHAIAFLLGDSTQIDWARAVASGSWGSEPLTINSQVRTTLFLDWADQVVDTAPSVIRDDERVMATLMTIALNGASGDQSACPGIAERAGSVLGRIGASHAS